MPCREGQAASFDKIQFFPKETLLGLPSWPEDPPGQTSPQNRRTLGLRCWCVHSLTGLQGRGPAHSPDGRAASPPPECAVPGQRDPEQTSRGTGDNGGGGGQHEEGEGEGQELHREGFLEHDM